MSAKRGMTGDFSERFVDMVKATDEQAVVVEELLTLMRPVLLFSDRARSGRIDVHRPEHEMREYERSLASSATKVSAERLASAIKGAFASFDQRLVFERFVEEPRRPSDARYACLHDYLDEAEKELPFLVTMMLGSSRLLKLEFQAKLIAAGREVSAARVGSGEPRAEALRKATGLLFESVYLEVATVLYELERVRRNEKVTSQEFGNMVDTVSAWTGEQLTGFLMKDAAKLRNAAYHHHWHYDEKTRRIDAHNKRRTWNCSLSMPELYALLKQTLKDVHSFASAMASRSARNMFALFAREPLIRILGPGGLDGKGPSKQEVDGAMRAAFTPIWERLAGIDWAPRVPDGLGDRTVVA